jgi:hypothetical protein
MQGSSSNDLEILERIFNPEEGFAVLQTQTQEVFHDKIDPELLDKAKLDERSAISCAESDPVKALDILSNLIESCPFYASAYNNRAQVKMIIAGREEKDSCSGDGGVEAVMGDLDLALKYGVGLPIVLGNFFLTSESGNAYSQRALIKRKDGDLQGAELDFQAGARNGNAFAKSQVKDNPYAKMCNAMMQKAMKDCF